MAESSRPGVVIALLVVVGLAVFLFATETGKRLIGRGEPQPLAPMTHEARLERGRYLVENVLDCFACHADVDWKGSGQPEESTKGGGGRVYDDSFPFPIYAPNISPDPETGAGTWTDEQFRRALRDGIGHDGRKLLLFMPFEFFRHLTDEDLDAVIAYIRSIPPVKKKMPPIELPEEVRQAVGELSHVLPPRPQKGSPQAEHGAYLTTVAGCSFCHSSFHPGSGYNPAMVLAGGTPLHGPWGQVASANITPDASGIAHYDEAMFLRTIREGAVNGVRPLNHIMPWRRLRNMEDADLKAIFAYLRTLPPIQHRVDNTEPPRPCQLCKNTHGFGDRNE